MTTLRQAIEEFPILSYLQGRVKIRGTPGKYIRADCFECGGRRTLSVNKETKYFLCFRCQGLGGSKNWPGKAPLVLAIALLEGIPRSEAYQRIWTLTGLPEPIFTPTSKELPNTPTEAIALINCDPDNEFANYLRKRRVPQLIPVSYALPSGKYSGRVALPCMWGHQQVGSELKSIAGKKPKSLYYPPDQIQTGASVYTPTFFKPTEECILVESIIDAESFKDINHSVVGLYGASITDGQLAALASLGVTRLVWCLDGEAGKETAKNIQNHTIGLFENWVVPLPWKEDPNSLESEELSACLTRKYRVESDWDLLKLKI